jgi:tetratricopeptide (TPR) repeat protein
MREPGSVPMDRSRNCFRKFLRSGERSSPSRNDIVIRGMLWKVPKLVPRSAPAVLILLLVAAVAAFAAVNHLVNRFHANQQARGRKLYAKGLADMNAGKLNAVVEEFRAALISDPTNSDYQLSLGRALRDTGDPKRLDEAESYLLALWQRNPQDGTINLALGRVAARRGYIEDALRYYHNAMYGVWASDADANRRKARLELIDFLLQKGARAEAQSELLALAAGLPPDPALQLKTAQLFAQAQDYRDALAQYEQALKLDRNNIAALADAGGAAYHAGHYRTAQRYLQAAGKASPQDTGVRELLESANLILQTDPFVRRISDAERNRRITDAFKKAEERLKACAAVKGINLTDSANSTKPLATLAAQASTLEPNLRRLRSAEESDLPDTIMDLVFQIEQQTAAICGEPQGTDEALLLISRNREVADQ